MSKNEVIEVVEEKIRQDKNGEDFVSVKLSDGRYVNLLFDNFKQYEGLGTYTIEMTRNGKFWNVEPNSLKKSTGGTELPQEQQPKAEKAVVDGVRKIFAPKPNAAQTDTNRAILLQVCIKAAAEVYHASGGMIEVESKRKFVEDNVINMASSFLKWAENNAQATIAENNAQATIEEVPF